MRRLLERLSFFEDRRVFNPEGIQLGSIRKALPSLLALWCSVTPGQTAEPGSLIRFDGRASELIVSEVSERTVRLQLSPLNEAGQPRSATPSTVLIPFASGEKLRVRELSSARELSVGALRVSIKVQPLTISLRRAAGQLVQELTFDEAAATNAGVRFRTAAPVLGLGEGAQQFDRRGALYPMEPSWGGWNRPVLGSVVPSPFIIGTDGWALFAHRPEGQFDLREGQGRFLPKG